MKISTLLMVGMCGVAPALCAQQATRPSVSLKASTKIGSPLVNPTAIMAPAMCDAAGSVYILPADLMHRSSIQKVSPDAKLAGDFKLPDSYPGDVRAGFVDHDGKVYMAVNERRGVYVAEFAQDGSAKAETKLGIDSHVEAWRLAVFKSGEYLLVGQTGLRDERAPFTAVFAADGHLVKKIYEPEDEEAYQAGKLNAKSGSVISNSNNFVISGDVAAGSDGNAYLLRGGAPSLVYVISPAGDVLRKLRVDAGNPDLMANGIKFYNGRLAIGFDWLDAVHQNLIKVVDLNGNSITDYEVGTDEYPILACYNSEGFTMIPASSETEVHLLKVKLP